ncbi:MAG: hypothetical protein ACYC1T_11840 [Sulfuricaulis sp.]
MAECRTAGKNRKRMASARPKTVKPGPGLTYLMITFSGPTDATTLKPKATESALIKIKNQPQEKPENLIAIYLFLSAGV